MEDVSAHHDIALLTWLLVPAGTVLVKGHHLLRNPRFRQMPQYFWLKLYHQQKPLDFDKIPNISRAMT